MKNAKEKPVYRKGRVHVLEAITDRCIREATAQMDKQLAASVQGYHAKTNPLGREQAEAILHSLIRIAAAQRALLPSRLQTALEQEQDTQYAAYYAALQQVCECSVELNHAYEEKSRAEEDYRYLHSMQQKVTASAYEARVLPAAEELQALPHADLWGALAENG